MNNIRIPLLIIVVFAALLNVQAQRTKAELTFKDGTVKEGLGKLVGNKIKFRANRNEKTIKYHFSLLKQAKIYYQDNISIYVYLEAENTKKPRVLEEVAIGKVSLYRTATQGYAPYAGSHGGFGGVGFTGGHSYSIKNFYVREEHEEKVTHLGSNQLFTKNFKQAASNFFKDCPTLAQKIQNKTLKKRDLIAIVEYYNQDCN